MNLCDIHFGFCCQYIDTDRTKYKLFPDNNWMWSVLNDSILLCKRNSHTHSSVHTYTKYKFVRIKEIKTCIKNETHTPHNRILPGSARASFIIRHYHLRQFVNVPLPKARDANLILKLHLKLWEEPVMAQGRTAVWQYQVWWQSQPFSVRVTRVLMKSMWAANKTDGSIMSCVWGAY